MITRLFGSASVAVLLSLAAVSAAAQNKLWIQQFGTGSNDTATGGAMDGAGGMYLCGWTSGNLFGPNLGKSDAWLTRYDGAGNPIWSSQFGTSTWDEPNAAAPDGMGGVYVGGFTTGSLGGWYFGYGDGWLARYDGAGNQLWIKQFWSDVAEDLTVLAPDGLGGVFACGYTDSHLGFYCFGCEDTWVAHFDGAGVLIWVRKLGVPGPDNPRGCASDGSGGVYVAGITLGSLGGPSAGDYDVWLARFDESGSQAWMIQFGTAQTDIVSAVAIDEFGGVFLAGYTRGNLAGPSAGWEDVWVARYDGMGNRDWFRQFGTPQSDYATSIIPDGSGGVFVSGASSAGLGGTSAGLADAWLGRIDRQGNQLWLDELGTSTSDWARFSAADGSGGLFVGGTTGGSLGGPSSGGEDAWIARYDGSCNAGETYCTASTTSIPSCQPAISATGSPSLVTASSFTLASGSVPGDNLGICFFGASGPASIPFGALGGQICMQGPIFRSAPKPSGGSAGVCDGNYGFTLQDLINASPIVTSGAVIHAEIWARDPANADGFLLSDGLRFTVCP